MSYFLGNIAVCTREKYVINHDKTENFKDWQYLPWREWETWPDIHFWKHELHGSSGPGCSLSQWSKMTLKSIYYWKNTATDKAGK